MIPDELALRIAGLKRDDHARLLVEFLVDAPEPAQLFDLISALNAINVRGVEFSGVFTMLPVPLESDRVKEGDDE